VLAAVVMTLGLVMVNRALGGQLGAVRRIEQSDETLSLVRGTLLEFEALALAASPRDGRSGELDAPAGRYQWSLAAEPRNDLLKPDGSPEASTVSVLVERDTPRASASMTALWPAAWVQ
jgi:hypothetical protein